jgi:hypothetical protein
VYSRSTPRYPIAGDRSVRMPRRSFATALETYAGAAVAVQPSLGVRRRSPVRWTTSPLRRFSTTSDGRLIVVVTVVGFPPALVSLWPDAGAPRRGELC